VSTILPMRWLDDVWSDAIHVLRSVRRQPGFAAVAVLTLALGIGANTAIFSVVDTLLLRAPDIGHLDRLVSLRERNLQKIPFAVEASPGKFLDWRDQAHAFDQMAAWRNWYFTLSEPTGGVAAPESIRGVRVSPNFFSMIGVSAALGRAFTSDEEIPGHDHVAMLSDGLWKRRFGGDATVVGRTVLIEGSPFTVVGVLPSGYQFFQPDLDVWMPLAVDAAFHDRDSHSVIVFGRLAPAASLPRAQAEMDAIARRLGGMRPETDAGWSVLVAPVYPTAEVNALRPALLILMGAAGLVLLIACANVANLLLARAIARHKEIVVRAAIGASRGRLIRQMLTESIVIAAIGGMAAILVARWSIVLLVPLLPHAGTNHTVSAFRSISPTLDARILVFSLALAVTTGIVFGLTPALQTTRPNLLRACTSSPKPRAGRTLLVSELSLAIVLLSGAGLLIESFWHLQHVDPGFQTDHLLTMQVWLPNTKYPAASDVRGFFEEVVRRVEALPGVRGASAISYRPFLSMGIGASLEIEGRAPSSSGEQPSAEYRIVTPGFIRVIGQPLIKGRDFDDHDREFSDGVAIVNEAMARRFWPNGTPIGRRVRPAFHRTTVPWELNADPRWLTVVGVVRNIKGLVPNERDQSQMYISSNQFPFSYMFLVIRTVAPPLTMTASIQDQIRHVDPDQPVADVRTMDDAVAASVPRFNVELLAIFALMAVFLAAVGAYGVSSYAVSQREQEIGIRMALGAQQRDVLAMVVRETLTLAFVGVGIGLAVSLALTRTMSGLLYGVSATDLRTFVGAAALLVAVVLLAGYLPARRAARLDPAATFRGQT
jgi:putative ABC transport system permease protein